MERLIDIRNVLACVLILKMALEFLGRVLLGFLNGRNVDPIIHSEDEGRKIEFCNWYLINSSRMVFEKIIGIYEAHVMTDGLLKRHNHNFWDESNYWNCSYTTVRKVWVECMGVTGDSGQIVLRYKIFNRNLKSQGYIRILEKHIALFENWTLYFQHDGVSAHNSKLFNREFGNQWVGNIGPIMWPARSPNLIPQDLAFIKHKIYLNRINTELSKTFEEAVLNVTNIQIRNAKGVYEKDVSLCIEDNDHNLSSCCKLYLSLQLF